MTTIQRLQASAGAHIHTANKAMFYREHWTKKGRTNLVEKLDQAVDKALAKLILCPGIAPPAEPEHDFFTIKTELDAILEETNRPVYRFHLCQCHPKCPDLTGWYLELRPDDPDTVMRVHKGVAYLYFFKFGQDPHMTPADLNEADELNVFYNPVKLAAQWLVSVERYLLNGETLLVNSNGGIMPMEGAMIRETVESEDISWNDRFDDEQIVISRWPAAKHWYLSSNKHQRIFVPGKYDSYEEARKEALRYVPSDRLNVKESSGPLPPE